MKNLISLLLIALLPGCSLVGVHKRDIAQGNIITQEEVRRLHKGMTEIEVKNIMGDPVLMNIFTPNRMVYVYTFKQGYQPMTETRLTLTFQSGRLVEIVRL